MTMKTILIAAAASLFAFPALAIDPHVVHLGDVEQNGTKTIVVTPAVPAVPEIPAVTVNAGGPGSSLHAGKSVIPACNDGTAPEGWKRPGGFCEKSGNLATLVPSAGGVVLVKKAVPGIPGTPEVLGTAPTCTVTSYYATSVYDGSGSIFSPSNWNTTYSSTQTTTDGAC